MTSGGRLRRTILLIDSDEAFLKRTEPLLSEHRLFTARNISEAQALVADEAIEVALIGPTYAHEPGVAECSLLLDISPSLAMVLIANGLDAPTLKAALRAGFRDAIEAPLTGPKIEEVLGTLARTAERHDEVEVSGKSRLGRVITIMSPKGGAGKTVTTTNVALLLALWNPPGRVGILDADLQFGDVCLALSIEPKTSIVDLARNLDKIDQDLMESVMSRHESGLRVLAAPMEPALADEISTQCIVKVLGEMKRMFDYIVIDTAPFLDEPVLTILERSDDVILVVDMDMPSVKNAKLALDTLKLIDFPMKKIQLVLNRVNSKARLDVEELERSLDMKVVAAIPSDKLVPRSVNEGVPVVALSPRSRVARGFQNVVGLVAPVNAPSDDGSKRRLFG